MSEVLRYSKPCARADRGCRELARARSEKQLKKRRFCSCRCAHLDRVETGTWNVRMMSRADMRRGGLRGGKASGETRKSLAVRRSVEAIEPLIPHWLDAQLDGRGQRMVRVLVARGWRRGRASGLNSRWHADNPNGATQSEESDHDDVDAALAAV